MSNMNYTCAQQQQKREIDWTDNRPKNNNYITHSTEGQFQGQKKLYSDFNVISFENQQNTNTVVFTDEMYK